jgi:starvation-inducible outer membrane lipoprotein
VEQLGDPDTRHQRIYLCGQRHHVGPITALHRRDRELAVVQALAECVIGLFKTEVINQIGPWKSMREVEWEMLKWIDWYNNRRLLGRIG